MGPRNSKATELARKRGFGGKSISRKISYPIDGVIDDRAGNAPEEEYGRPENKIKPFVGGDLTSCEEARGERSGNETGERISLNA